jgi:hypothetical protein
VVERLLYLSYYVMRTPASEFSKLIRFVTKEKGISTVPLYTDILYSSIRYNISFMDYFSFRFYNIGKKEREEYIGSGAMYEFQLKMNPKKFRHVLHDKIAFLQKFDDCSGRNWVTIETLKKDPQKTTQFLSSPSGKAVVKYSKGQSGKQVEILDTRSLNTVSLIQKMEAGNFDLLEEYIVQHDDLMRLSPSAVNTVRIVTQLHKGELIIVTARLRISVNSPVDNASVGNIVVPLDALTGVVTGPGIYADITKPDAFTHPVTGVDFIGFRVPFWEACVELVKKAAWRIPENRSIGWDIAVTKNKPVLIEGNHNWHYLVLQMPEKKGYKKKLLQYLNE